MLAPSFDTLPQEIAYLIITTDSQTWRAMRPVSTYYNQLLIWPAYVDKFTVVIVTADGKSWQLDGKLHREYDLPAYIQSDGTRIWYRYGVAYRGCGKPARLNPIDTSMWVKYGKIHRDGDRPAIIISGGTRKWYQHNKIHRDHDRPSIIWADNCRRW